MTRSFCTVITSDHIPYARTLFQSIETFDKNIDCFALIVDLNVQCSYSEFFVLTKKDLIECTLANDIFRKYPKNSDSLRWSLKSVLLLYLLENRRYDQVFFVDPDLYFVSDFKFLYKELGDSSFLLSPHWRIIDPERDPSSFVSAFTHGIFNAGFIGATASAVSTLYWWASLCLYRCDFDPIAGLYDDQKYLDYFIIKNPDSKILQHRGCNIAEWNVNECTRMLQCDNSVLIDGKFPIVFIHFSNISSLIENDPLLLPYLTEYSAALKQNGFDFDIVDLARKKVKQRKLASLSLSQRLVRRFVGRDNYARMRGWES